METWPALKEADGGEVECLASNEALLFVYLCRVYWYGMTPGSASDSDNMSVPNILPVLSHKLTKHLLPYYYFYTSLSPYTITSPYYGSILVKYELYCLLPVSYEALT